MLVSVTFNVGMREVWMLVCVAFVYVELVRGGLIHAC
jgi:hypothetical protein